MNVVELKQDAPAGLVKTTRHGSVLRLEMNNPPANALSIAMMQALKDANSKQHAMTRPCAWSCSPRRLQASCSRPVMISRNLPCIAPMKTGAGRSSPSTMKLCAELMQTIVHLPKPVIAEVDGLATAAGASWWPPAIWQSAPTPSAFCTPGVNIGLFCSTPMVALSRNVNRKQAMEMLLTGETIDASTAREFGLINRIVPRQYLNQVVMKYAEIIASKSPLTVKIGKEAFYRQAEMSLEDAYEYTAGVMVENMMARDAEEGINAFIAKRMPEWTGE
jgi:enoyl-CoA hydratase/carnithine racemase